MPNTGVIFMKNNLSYQTTKRSLTDKEAELLIREIRSLPGIIAYTKKDLKRFKEVWVAEIEGKFIGVVVNKDFWQDWTEVKILFVKEEYRDQGIGLDLFKTALNSIKERKRNLYVVSRNPIVVKWMKDEKIPLLKIYQLPIAIRLNIIKKSLNLQRIFEYLRKALILRNKHKWVYGVKRYPNAQSLL
ncbi:TPA: hypothetical protein DDW69_02455 [candidate division CPR2 bacterium]|uniref:N-acetyltransferase domain-containing protein n=1 Tax=candidate division CPR2 bacterium GW2011_GWC1_41_48 TaxID=1618344 RepID=A0A0G0ZA10_UNCC2|nr:MAG: GCN5-related N-acetyltransferase [candidate division CPR2 bacterium GW2011_GWC2_39_35]KKR27624.1 MAG: GCN5-related N-acetyltransferase [candidate division CPR2 bacterium GW2011_GWD1_39_7]KKR28845.1 MAG: GCN5-related N-acetyltransferase [candidate division CPR2 bacterium GW2011_GWD2_39_7]KKS09888.1 MAG: hypothetical protein UU65_C0001G0293 [candidate division CPR2 bacterium GW2011_GWC1_41_48]OGB59446.1 MAG: hypothetical protein A2Y27_03845 [candidate division CPR2 bacterium GWD1_39_7]OG